MLDKLITEKEFKDFEKKFKKALKANTTFQKTHVIKDIIAEEESSPELTPNNTPDNEKPQDIKYPGSEETTIDTNIEPGKGDNIVNTVPDFEVGTDSIEPECECELNSQIVNYLNERIGDEYLAHYFYTCASNWCIDQGFDNAGKYFFKEAMEELSHAQKIQKYMVDWNIVPTIPQVDTQHEFKSLVDIVNKAYKLEHDLYKKYDETSRHISQIDLSTFDFLQWFREKQQTSVAEFADLLSKLKLIDYTDKLSMVIFEQNNFGD